MSPYDDSRPVVVCVDDDEPVVDLLTTMLGRVTDFVLEGFSDPEAALSRVREGDVDCVVSDFEMPGVDGFELFERIRRLDPDIPFIVYTGRTSDDTAVEAVSRGVTDYIRKEHGVTQFVLLGHRIEAAVARYRAERVYDRHRQTLDAVDEGICVVAEDGTVEHANRAYLDLYGYRESDLLDADWKRGHTAGEVEWFRSEVFPAVEADGKWSGERVARREDGTTFRAGVSVSSLPDGGFVIVVVDLEDHRWHGGADRDE